MTEHAPEAVPEDFVPPQHGEQGDGELTPGPEPEPSDGGDQSEDGDDA